MIKKNTYKKTEPEDAHDAEVINNSIITTHNNLELSLSGKTIHGNTSNAYQVLLHNENFNGNIWFDEFHQKIFTTYNPDKDDFCKITREWEEEDNIRLSVFMQRELQMSAMSDETVNKAIRIYARKHIKNEPRDWMESLVWDGSPRIETFFIDCMGSANNEYTRAVSKNFWISMTARIYHPGCQMRNMVILEGLQNSGKSKALLTIGGKWYCDCLEDINSKDFFQVLQGRLIIEIGELSSFRRAEMTRVKQVVSCQSDRFRTPYDRHPKDNARTCVFVGSTNDSNYFNDNTGATRFWPIKTNEINIDLIQKNREQLFAEAVVLYKKGLTWWEIPSSAQHEQEERRQIDPWEDVLFNYLKNKEDVTTIEILKDCLHIEDKQQTRADQMRIGIILKLLGWEKTQKWFGTIRKWVYSRPIDSTIELPQQENINWDD